MNQFSFPLDAEGQAFCCDIAKDMMRLFLIPKDEAIGRINREWRNVSILDRQHPLYHEDSDFWAKDIYYGHDSSWWIDEARAVGQPYP